MQKYRIDDRFYIFYTVKQISVNRTNFILQIGVGKTDRYCL